MLKAKEFLKDDMVFPQIPKMLKNRGDLRKWKLLQDKGFDRRGIKLYKKERVKKIDLRKRVFFSVEAQGL